MIDKYWEISRHLGISFEWEFNRCPLGIYLIFEDKNDCFQLDIAIWFEIQIGIFWSKRRNKK